MNREQTGASAEVIANAIYHRLRLNWRKHFPTDCKIGLDELSVAVDEVAEFHAGCEELGSSDVSIMVNEVLKQLGVQQ